ncbi:unnamed protein product [Cylindrotheca closterium]|uniref:[histone H3]-lysine(4) N-trimethyltransferase n=1 Tax=Cylindrotheca closterium TaxID=2856 RepID=A0AAD2JNE1_9STRA|nr:unnamed protein product [Cylindrotheca closterium]
MPKERKKSEHESRKRRLLSPFRIKVGCVVALRFRIDGNHIVHEASQGFTSFEKNVFDLKKKAFNDVWCDPKPGYDRGFNLVGRYIRCCFPKLVLSSSFHVPEASTQFLEGEIVSTVKDESQTICSKLSYRQKEGRGTAVDLLISKECFKSMPFLLRFRMDSDVDTSRLDESSRRHHLNELRIKGSGKAIVRVVLSGMKQQKGDDRLVVRWVVRKRIFVGNLIPSKTGNEATKGVGDAIAISSQIPKRRKIADSRQMFIGDGYDTELQQRTNWRWFASKFNPMSFARTFRIPFEFFGCAISQAVGEVVRIIPEPPDSASLAMVTVRRLVLPEHTLVGRLSSQRDNAVFQDFDDSKRFYNNGQALPEEERETGSALFNVPIEEILVISKKIHDGAAVQQNETIRGLVLTDAYSLDQNEFFNFNQEATHQFVSAQNMNHQGLSDGADLFQEKGTTKSSTPTRGAPDCFGSYNSPLQNHQKLFDFAVSAATTSHSIQASMDERSTFWTTQGLLKLIPNLDFSINHHDFIPLTNLASSKPNFKKKKNISIKSKRNLGINTLPSPASTTVKAALPVRPQGIPSVQPPSQHNNVDTPLRNCSRTFQFNQQTRGFEAGTLELTDFHDKVNSPPEKVRNCRPHVIPLTRRNQDAHPSNRALRANQRRLLRNVVSIGLNVDTLAGRDYEEHLRFDRSNIHAWGVFTDKEIKQNQMIVEYRGEIIGNSVAEKRELEYVKSNIGSDYMFRIDAFTVCDATKQGNVARFINHSCNPNCFTKIIYIEGIRRIVIYAKRNIDFGEELGYDYKFPLEYDPEKRIECHCGARICSGYMNWDKRYNASIDSETGT